jgi:hypothetical protein
MPTFGYARNVSTHPKKPTRPTINEQKTRDKLPTLKKPKEPFFANAPTGKPTLKSKFDD